VHTYTIYITLNCKRTPYIEVAHTSYLTSSLNTFIGKTSVPNIPLYSNRFLHFLYIQASQANLKALYRILIDVKPLVSAVAWW